MQFPPNEKEAPRLTLAAMDRHNIVLGFLSGYDGKLDSFTPDVERVQARAQAAPGRFLPGVFLSEPGKPAADFLRKEYAAGRLKGLGERLPNTTATGRMMRPQLSILR